MRNHELKAFPLQGGFFGWGYASRNLVPLMLRLTGEVPLKPPLLPQVFRPLEPFTEPWESSAQNGTR
jgi:hypothetical protein